MKSKTKQAHRKVKRIEHRSVKRDIVLWGLPILILLVLFNSAVILSRVQQATARDAAKTPQARSNFAIMQFSWKDNVPANDDMIKLEKSYKVVGINTQILNLGKATIWLAPSVESFIRDDSGDRYGMVFAAELSKPFIAGDYAPQYAASGELTYAIPKNSKNPEWCYALSESNGGGEPICIPLNSYAKLN